MFRDYIYLMIFLVLFLFVLYLSNNDMESFCEGDNLDYYGYMKCLDWEEVKRREKSGNL